MVTNITQYYFQVNEQNLHDLNFLAQVVNHYAIRYSGDTPYLSVFNSNAGKYGSEYHSEYGHSLGSVH